MSSKLASRSRSTRSMPSPPSELTRSSAVSAGTVTRCPLISVTNCGSRNSRVNSKPTGDARLAGVEIGTMGTEISGQKVSRAAARPVKTPSGIHSAAARRRTSGFAESCQRQRTPGARERKLPSRAMRSAVRRRPGWLRVISTPRRVKISSIWRRAGTPMTLSHFRDVSAGRLRICGQPTMACQGAADVISTAHGC